ncbi:Protein JINGUBANG [Linum grandiflorum]
MKIHSCFTGGEASPVSDHHNNHSDDSSTTTTTTSASNSPSSSTGSLYSNLSLQTHPSLPSLNKSPFNSSSSGAAAVDFLCFTTLRPSSDHHPITSLSVHGNLLYAASGHQISIYDCSTGFLINSFNGSSSTGGSIKAVIFSDNGRILSAHQDSHIRAWKSKPKSTESNQHKLIATLPTAADRLRHFAFPSSYVAVRRHRKIMKIQHADAVSDLAVNGGQFYSVSWDRSLKIWKSSSLRCIESIQAAHDDAINSVVVSRDGTVYTGSADCRIRVWNKPGSRHSLVATLEKHKSAVNALALTADGSVLFSGSCDRSILVWEREDTADYMTVIGALRGHEKAVLCLISVGDLLVSGSADRTVRIWARGSGGGGGGKYRCLAVMEGHTAAVKSLAGYCEDGVVSVYSGSLDGEIKVWRVEVR